VSRLFRAAARERRATLGGPFTFGIGQADFSATSWVPAPADTSQASPTSTSTQKVAVGSCVSLAGTVAEMLPLDVFRGTGANRVPVAMPSWLADLSGDGQGLHDWVRQAIYSGMLRGNLFGQVLARDSGTGQARQIALAHPDSVSVRWEDGDWWWAICGRTVPDSEVWHRRVFAAPGSKMGLSPIAQHALTIGVGLAAENFGARWFADGAHPSALLSTEQNLSEDSAQTAKKRFMRALQGRREPLVLGQGWTYQAIQVAPNESQFLETQKYTDAQCCRIFGPAFAEVLGYETGGTMTYSNREQRTLDFLTFAADPWLVRVERWLSDLLPRGQYVKFNRAALLRTDLLTRFKAYNVGIASKFMVPSEARDFEDWMPFTEAQKAEIPEVPTPAVPFDQTGAKD